MRVADRLGLCVAILLSAPAAARAERNWSFHGVGTLRSGWSDNIASAPEDAPPGTPAREAAGFSTVAPGLRAVVHSPRSIHILGYTFELNKTIDSSQVEDSLANRLSWEWLYYVSPTSDVQTSVLAEHGRTGAFVGLGGPVGVNAVPSGSYDFLNLRASEAWTFNPSRKWRIAQLGTVTGFTQLTGGLRGGGVNGGAGASAERLWRSTALGARLETGYSKLDQRDGSSMHQLTWRAVATLRRDLGERFAFSLQGGVGGLGSTGSRVKAVIRPLFQTALYLTTADWASARIAYQRDLRPDLYIGENIDTDEVQLDGNWALPLMENHSEHRRPFTLSASAGAGYARLLDLRRPGVEDKWLLVDARASAAWRVRENLQLVLSYQHVEQNRRTHDSSAALTGLLPFSQNTVSLSVSGRYPAERKEITELPRVRGKRVDGSDVSKDEGLGPRRTGSGSRL